MKIKVCGMRDAENIAQLCTLPIDYIGFIFFAKSPRYVGEDFDKEIANSVPKHIVRTGVFVDAGFDYVKQKIENYGLTAVQLHGKESPDFCGQIQSLGCSVIKAFGVDEGFDFGQLAVYNNCVDYFLFDTKSAAHGGTGQKFDWKVLTNYSYSKPFFLSGGISAADKNILHETRNLPIACFDLNSKFEIEPALKDIQLLNDFIRLIKT